MRGLAILLAAAALGGCGGGPGRAAGPPPLDGTYRAELSAATLERAFPQTSAPAGRWVLKIDTELDYAEVGAPDGGGFSLGIAEVTGDRITFEATRCTARDGSPAGPAVYAVRREGARLRFVEVRDRCAETDPEAALLSAATWARE